jgi:hypothetical protein
MKCHEGGVDRSGGSGAGGASPRAGVDSADAAIRSIEVEIETGRVVAVGFERQVKVARLLGELGRQRQ